MEKRFRGDTIPMTWAFTLNGKPHDLTNVTSMTFAYREKSGGVVKISGVATDALAGIAKFDIGSNVFAVAGVFEFDIQLVYSDGTKRTYIKDRITIEDDINKD